MSVEAHVVNETIGLDRSQAQPEGARIDVVVKAAKPSFLGLLELAG